ncbi:retrovirus-related pol polyprotein from transposon TNT 1-94 [Tanacetum coccineum]
MDCSTPPIGQMKITCEACVKGKHHRVSFPKQSKWRSSEKLELIHSNLCGPITPPSNGQKRYLISFIDDFSRKTWIYFVVEKLEAFHIFKEFKARVEKQSGSFIKCLRTDRGGEYNSTEFKEFCKEHGIKRQLTTAYTPQQNGVAKRKNRTIMNMVRAVLSEKEVPKSFWPNAVQWANHVLNRSPTTIMKDMTPEEAWSGSKPSVEHFRVFGCIGYVYVPDVKRTKLDDKSVKCVMIGYSSESKAFKMFDPVENKAHVSRDVIFEEEKKWNWDDSYSSEQNLELEWEDEYECVENEIEDEEVESEELEDNENQNEEENADDSPSPTQIDIGAATSSRPRRPPVWQADYTSGEELSDDEANMARIVSVAFMIITDLTTFCEAAGHLRWKEAMDAEIASIKKNQTWSLVILPDGAKAIGVKWIYKTKFNELGEVDKFKARLVVKGYAQEYGIDYTEVFAPVARMDTLKDDVFVEQPQGYEVAGKEHMVYKLNKALYGLKQAPRAWFSRIEAYFTQEGFESSISEQTLFIKRIRGKILIVSIYVDDLLFTGDDDELLDEFKQSMKKEFDMTDLGRMRYFLGIEVVQKNDGIFICQRKYQQCHREIWNAEFQFCMQSNSSCRFMANPMQLHFTVVKRIMRYLKGDIDDSKSTSGYVFLMGGGAVAWSSRKQPIVTLSTTEAEYIAAATCACQAIWMRRVLKEIGYDQGGEMVLLCDNTSTIKLSKNAVLHTHGGATGRYNDKAVEDGNVSENPRSFWNVHSELISS